MSADRRCAPRARPAAELRPSELLAAFFGTGLAFGLAAAGVALANLLAGVEEGRWLALHLLLVGGVSSLVLGAAQFFAGAFLASGPPPRWLVRAQLGLLVAGVACIAAGRAWAADPLTLIGAAALLATLAAFVGGLDSQRRASVQRAPWALRWYVAAAVFLALGIVAGAALATGAAWTHGDLLSAHLALNVGGWLGTAIVGTMHTFYPSVTGTQLAFPRLQGPTLAGWAGGVAMLAVGYGLGLGPLAVAGWIAMLAAAGLLGANVLAGARAGRPLGLSARLLGLGHAFLIAGLAIAALVAAGSAGAGLAGDGRASVAALLLGGWVGMTVLGSLIRLLSVLRHVRTLPRPEAARPWAVERGAPPLAAVGALALAGGQADPLSGLAGPGAMALALAYAVLAARVLTLAASALRAAPLRI